MEWYIILLVIILVIAAYTIGNFLGKVSGYPKEIQGYLHIVSDPVKGNYVYLEMENAEDLDTIARSEHVVLQVTRDKVRSSYEKGIGRRA